MSTNVTYEYKTYECKKSSFYFPFKTFTFRNKNNKIDKIIIKYLPYILRVVEIVWWLLLLLLFFSFLFSFLCCCVFFWINFHCDTEIDHVNFTCFHPTTHSTQSIYPIPIPSLWLTETHTLFVDDTYIYRRYSIHFPIYILIYVYIHVFLFFPFYAFRNNKNYTSPVVYIHFYCINDNKNNHNKTARKQTNNPLLIQFNSITSILRKS